MKHPSVASMVLYAQLAFPLAFAGLPLYIHAPDFYATHYGISLGFLGVALLAIRLLDAVADPFIGRLCDAFPAWRVRVMAIAAVLFAAAFAALYQPPPALEMFWFVLTTFVATLSFSVLFINLNAIGSLMAPDEAARTAISSWREALGLAGLMAAVLLPAAFSDMLTYALLCAVIALLSASAFLLWYRRQGFSVVAADSHGALPFHRMLQAPFGGFFLAYLVGMFASSLPAVLVVFYVRDWLGAAEMTGGFLLLYFVAAVAAIPLWRLAARRFGNRQLWFFAMCLGALAISVAALARPDALGIYIIVCLVSGAAFGGELFLPPAILSARIAAAGLRDHTSSFFGLYAFCMKAALALSSALAFAVLDGVGFQAGARNEAFALSALVVLYAVAPAVLKLVAALILLKTGDDHEKPFYPFPHGGRHVS